jgi:hypothetical protein
MADESEPEFEVLHEDVQTEILALSLLLEQFGPQLGWPRVDTLNGSLHANMRELRFRAVNGEWLLPLIPSAGQSCLWREINRASAKSASIATDPEGR